MSRAASIAANSVRYYVIYALCPSTGSIPFTKLFVPVLEWIVNAPPPFLFLTVPSAAAMNPFSMFSRVGSLNDLRLCPCILVNVSFGMIDEFTLLFLTEQTSPPIEVILAGIQSFMLQEDIFVYPVGLMIKLLFV